MSVEVPIERGKYVARVSDHGEVTIDRGEISGWCRNPPGSKAWIAALHELVDARQLLGLIADDFDPERTVGPPCGPVVLTKILKHFEAYGINRANTVKP